MDKFDNYFIRSCKGHNHTMFRRLLIVYRAYVGNDRITKEESAFQISRILWDLVIKYDLANSQQIINNLHGNRIYDGLFEGVKDSATNLLLSRAIWIIRFSSLDKFPKDTRWCAYWNNK